MMKYMKYGQYVWSIFIMIIVAILFEKFKMHNAENDDERNYRLVKKYLITESSLAKSKLPILWIYMDYSKNSRNWASFYSRNSEDLNQPYIFLTIKSIIDRCGNDFNICLINDTSLKNIVPDWNIDLDSVGEPVKSKLRDLACAKLLNFYGGLFVPPSFLCLKNLKQVYKECTANGKICVGDMLNKNVTSEYSFTLLSKNFIGSRKNNDTIKEYIDYIQKDISTDYTAASIFEGNLDRWLYKQEKMGKVSKIPANLLGVKDNDGKVVLIENLIGTSFVDFSCNALGIYIPQDEILNRTDFNWFARLSADQAIKSDTTIGKLLLINYNI